MHPLIVAIKQKLMSGNFTEDDYNTYIFSGVANGLIKDITSENIVLESNHAVYAVVELPDGSQFEIDIWEKIRKDPNIPEYDITVKQRPIKV